MGKYFAKNRYFTAAAAAACAAVALVSAAAPLAAHANSGPDYYYGTDGTVLYPVDDCPLEVEGNSSPLIYKNSRRNSPSMAMIPRLRLNIPFSIPPMRTWWWACSSRSAQFETLPKGELSFMLSTDPDPKNIPNTGYVLAIVLIVLAIAVPVLLVAAVVVIFVVAYKRAKDNKGHN